MHNDPTFRDSHYSEPTEYQPPPEPLSAAYRNPYETFNPYDRGVPPAPPPLPPSKQRHTGLLVISVSLLCVVMILGGVIFGIMMMRGQQQASQVTSTPTASAATSAPTAAATSAPTAPAVQPVGSSANDIYNDFSRSGSGGINVRRDNNWNCCTYIPEGGALVWTDSASGYTLDIATFKNTNEATVDATQLDSQNFASNVVRTCLLSYDKNVPGSVLSRYVQLMQTYCK